MPGRCIWGIPGIICGIPGLIIPCIGMPCIGVPCIGMPCIGIPGRPCIGIPGRCIANPAERDTLMSIRLGEDGGEIRERRALNEACKNRRARERGVQG
jgi:hypothetical protein